MPVCVYIYKDILLSDILQLYNDNIVSNVSQEVEAIFI